MKELLGELPTLPCPANEEEACLGDASHGCQPCLLHIATGKGLRQMSDSSMEAADSHGLFMTENDKDGMFTLFQCEAGTLSAGDTGTPLARLEAISGSEQCPGPVALEEAESSSLSAGLHREDASCSLAEQHHIQEDHLDIYTILLGPYKLRPQNVF
ncbi:unnamed protein product [Ranitomeya imitator]|uniref:Uncharacterized protein n=1 Tax=Ranitomeya imitator TaxID=111125 RepID=A0ABN9LHA1_9NEOB|nr:unnamed protein product [Ranitomeya imitator]